jgi:uncharacterized protein
MGPSNVALLKLYRADQALREAGAKLNSVTRDVRAQEARNTQLKAKLDAAVARHKDLQAKSANNELELKVRGEHIDKLRDRQTSASNNKEYQALLVEINTAKVDRAKLEESAIKVMEQLEAAGNEAKTLSATFETEEAKLAEMRAKVGDKAAAAQAEVDRMTPDREAAAREVKPEVLAHFDKLAERFDGEAMAAIERPNPREEEYLCTGCNMSLVADVYNKLKTRDEPLACPTCRRYLFIPDSMSNAEATAKKTVGRSAKATKEKTDRKVTKLDTPVMTVPQNKWHTLVTAAQGESVEGARDADHKPVDCKVEINGEEVGTYRGKTAEHLERVIRFRMEEAKMNADVKVTPV